MLHHSYHKILLKAWADWHAGPPREAGVAASNSASADANTAATGTRPYLRVQFGQFDELTEMPISILSMGMGVCTHSVTTSNK